MRCDAALPVEGDTPASVAPPVRVERCAVRRRVETSAVRPKLGSCAAPLCSKHTGKVPCVGLRHLSTMRLTAQRSRRAGEAPD